MNQRIVVAGLLLLACASGVLAQVKVEKAPAKVETKYFDPKRPPGDMPKLGGNEAAVTVSMFNINASAGGDVMEEPDAQSGTRVTVKIDHFAVKLDCDVVMWLPNKPPNKLVEHEDGHRQITERFYESADDRANKLARAWIGQTVVGRGKDAQAAARAAIQSAIGQLNGQYMDAVYGESRTVQEAFDRISVHGTNKLTARQGVDQAFAEYERGK